MLVLKEKKTSPSAFSLVCDVECIPVALFCDIIPSFRFFQPASADSVVPCVLLNA